MRPVAAQHGSVATGPQGNRQIATLEIHRDREQRPRLEPFRLEPESGTVPPWSWAAARHLEKASTGNEALTIVGWRAFSARFRRCRGPVAAVNPGYRVVSERAGHRAVTDAGSHEWQTSATGSSN